MPELEKDIGILRKGLAEVKKVIAVQLGGRKSQTKENEAKKYSCQKLHDTFKKKALCGSTVDLPYS